jgi:hypothetical protein
VERLANVLRCRFSRIASIGYDPINIAGAVGERLDTPVALSSDLAAHGVDGDERELVVRGQLIKRIGGVC